jgi:hypothetical protein
MAAGPPATANANATKSGLNRKPASQAAPVFISKGSRGGKSEYQDYPSALRTDGFIASADFQCEHVLHHGQRHTDVSTCQQLMMRDDT